MGTCRPCKWNAEAARFQDRPKGYIQRVALTIFGFMLFGACLGHLSYMTNDTHYRSLVLLLIFCVQLNDVFAFIVGKPKLLGSPYTFKRSGKSGAQISEVLPHLAEIADPRKTHVSALCGQIDYPKFGSCPH